MLGRQSSSLACRTPLFINDPRAQKMVECIATSTISEENRSDNVQEGEKEDFRRRPLFQISKGPIAHRVWTVPMTVSTSISSLKDNEHWATWVATLVVASENEQVSGSSPISLLPAPSDLWKSSACQSIGRGIHPLTHGVVKLCHHITEKQRRSPGQSPAKAICLNIPFSVREWSFASV
ncbi:hypothetical protein P154DRAFT_290988 [Amniculicola lignicola CBS 123094]|uniref:Uncharacterized protein n=1 Tax=Amniculicola lignicola CBS 123094 TaxID=1392246 RepID=A0A6A5X1U8_9PLEO|nr:hypothetical protein P154DRAFT_290988 [Amniculicola lignicola CBS 123094]